MDIAAQRHSMIEKLIDNSNFNEAFLLLKKNLSDNLRIKYNDKITRLEETYKYMLHYLIEGFQDDNKENQISEIKSFLYLLNDSLLRESYLVDSPFLYYSTKRFETIRRTSLISKIENLIISYKENIDNQEAQNSKVYQKNVEEALDSLFLYVWTIFGNDISEYNLLKEKLEDPDFPDIAKKIIISALLLGNLYYFDPNSLKLLISIYANDISISITARALVAAFLIILANEKKVKYNIGIINQLKTLEDSILSFPRLKEVALNFIKTKDTQRITEKMQKEVIPELMKLRPDILNKIKDLTDSEDSNNFDLNPDWEDLFDNSSIGNKLKELNDLQIEGADVMMLAFSNLKNFPFFNSVSNWFLPFSENHSMIADSLKNCNEAFKKLLNVDYSMCDSDKYSFALSMNQLPQSQVNFMQEKLNQQFEQLKELQNDQNLKKKEPLFTAEITKYFRDLYRFFKLYRRKQEFIDPFQIKTNIFTLPVIGTILEEEEFMELISEFYFKNGYFEEALPIFRKINEKEGNNVKLWQKVAFCYSSMKDTTSALEWYKKAELIEPDNLWLIKKIAISNRLLNNFSEAADYYDKALSFEPENFNLLVNAGHVNLEAHNYDKALSYYYHANYINPENISVLRAIAWSELMKGDKSKSKKTYEKIILSDNKQPDDYINFGYVFLAENNLKKTYEQFRKFLELNNNDMKLLVKSLVSDRESINLLGIKTENLKLLLEKIRYDLQR